MNAPQFSHSAFDHLAVLPALGQPAELCDHVGHEIQVDPSASCLPLPLVVAKDAWG